MANPRFVRVLAVFSVALLHGCAEPRDPRPDGDLDDPDIANVEETDGTPAAAGPCAPEAYAVSDALSVYGCAPQIDAVIDAVIDAEGNLVDDATAAGDLAALTPDPLEATNGRRLKRCRWSSFTDTAKSMLVMCPAEKHIVSGGCFAQTRMVNSAPFESQTIGNLPEAGERYQDVSPTSGWLCTYEGPTQSAGQKAAALCCE